MGSTTSKIDKNRISFTDNNNKLICHCDVSNTPFFPGRSLPPMLDEYLQTQPNYPCYYIYNLYVNPTHRKKRWCQKLTKAVVQYINNLSNGPCQILLHIRYNTPYIPGFRKCYERAGFQLVDEAIEQDPDDPSANLALFRLVLK